VFFNFFGFFRVYLGLFCVKVSRFLCVCVQGLFVEISRAHLCVFQGLLVCIEVYFCVCDYRGLSCVFSLSVAFVVVSRSICVVNCRALLL